MNWKPVGNKIIIKKVKLEKNSYGIYLPGASSNKENEGIVVAVGPGRYLQNGELVPVDARVGDTVLYTANVGIKIESDDDTNEYILIMETDIQAIKG